MSKYVCTYKKVAFDWLCNHRQPMHVILSSGGIRSTWFLNNIFISDACKFADNKDIVVLHFGFIDKTANYLHMQMEYFAEHSKQSNSPIYLVIIKPNVARNILLTPNVIVNQIKTHLTKLVNNNPNTVIHLASDKINGLKVNIGKLAGCKGYPTINANNYSKERMFIDLATYYQELAMMISVCIDDTTEHQFCGKCEECYQLKRLVENRYEYDGYENPEFACNVNDIYNVWFGCDIPRKMKTKKAQLSEIRQLLMFPAVMSALNQEYDGFRSTLSYSEGGK